jgi:hypothetical protein
MAKLFDKTKGSALGSGKIMLPGSLLNEALLGTLVRYRRSVASGYSPVGLDELASVFAAAGKGEVFLSEKLDGELWFLVLQGKEAFLANSRGRVIHGKLPFLTEAQGLAKKTGDQSAVFAGEFYATSAAGKDRPRVGDLAAALAAGKDKADRLRFAVFDIVELHAEDEDLTTYGAKLEKLTALFGEGKHLTVAPTEKAEGTGSISDRYESVVVSGQAEGLVLRTDLGRIYKLKPEHTIDAVVVGFSESSGKDKKGKEVRSISLALMRDDETYQLISGCGTLGGSKIRAALYKKLSALEVAGNFRQVTGDGALYRFVRPEVVVEVKVADIISLDSRDEVIRRLVLRYDGDAGWVKGRLSAGVSLNNPVLLRVRDDKQVTAEEVRFSQVEECCWVAPEKAGSAFEALPVSKLLDRQVYTKETKGQIAVRKLLLWQTNKEKVSTEYPAFVVHWTDYSPGRKEPLQHTVRPAATKKDAEHLAKGLIEANIKKGWEQVKPS